VSKTIFVNGKIGIEMKSFYLSFILALVGSIGVGLIYVIHDKKVRDKWGQISPQDITKQIENYEHTFKIKLYLATISFAALFVSTIAISMSIEVFGELIHSDTIGFNLFSLLKGNDNSALIIFVCFFAAFFALVFYSMSGHECLKCKKNFFHMLTNEKPAHYRSPIRRVWIYLGDKTFRCNHCGQEYRLR